MKWVIFIWEGDDIGSRWEWGPEKKRTQQHNCDIATGGSTEAIKTDKFPHSLHDPVPKEWETNECPYPVLVPTNWNWEGAGY